MAILINRTLETGLVLEGAYYKLMNVRIDEQDIVSFSGALWLNQEARDENKEPLIPMYYMNSFKTEDKTGNLFEQSYLYIMELASDENYREALLFEGAENV